MWWQSKEFSPDPERDRARRAERGWVLVVAVLVVPVVVVLLQWLARWLGFFDHGITVRVING